MIYSNLIVNTNVKHKTIKLLDKNIGENLYDLDILKDFLDTVAKSLFIKEQSDKLDFIIDENYFKVKTSGQKGDAETEYLHGENIPEVVKSGYSIPKLQEIMKAHKFSEQCNIYLGNDMPLKINFTLVTGDGNLEYLLAPRLEETD